MGAGWVTPERLFPAHGQPLLEDGTVDVRALCERWDREANKHAGPARFVSAGALHACSTLGQNRVVPASLPTTRDPASPTQED